MFRRTPELPRSVEMTGARLFSTRSVGFTRGEFDNSACITDAMISCSAVFRTFILICYVRTGHDRPTRRSSTSTWHHPGEVRKVPFCLRVRR